MLKIIKYRIKDDDKLVREIELKEDSTFLDLHNAIQESCKYDPTLLTSFYIADQYWDESEDPSKEIIMERMDEVTQKDCKIMSETPLNFEPVEVGQHYLYLFDFCSGRCFYIEVIGVRNFTKKDEKKQYPVCTLSEGKAPIQVDSSIDDLLEQSSSKKKSSRIDDDFDEDEDNPYYDNDYEDGYDDFGGGYDSSDLY
ncbi:MAG: hypothetical protein HUK15_01550 [Bacteroidales bacterium]|nr:hypothetical protein [Bacteroidales bacterium]